mmetsp:Transcript_12606/g.19081  ORF Transcript_12606/g.19081 Transcript_12606/m.19081 type:complete len:276 (-) Transcript_12606:1246-2073(-)
MAFYIWSMLNILKKSSSFHSIVIKIDLFTLSLNSIFWINITESRVVNVAFGIVIRIAFKSSILQLLGFNIAIIEIVWIRAQTTVSQLSVQRGGNRRRAFQVIEFHAVVGFIEVNRSIVHQMHANNIAIPRAHRLDAALAIKLGGSSVDDRDAANISAHIAFAAQSGRLTAVKRAIVRATRRGAERRFIRQFLHLNVANDHILDAIQANANDAFIQMKHGVCIACETRALRQSIALRICRPSIKRFFASRAVRFRLQSPVRSERRTENAQSNLSVR